MTAQVGDVISYLGETFSLHSNPLEQYFEAGHQRPKCLAEEIEYTFTANWRGYIAEWTIDNDILFMNNITGPKGKVSRAMSELFPDAQPPIEASWHTGKLRIPSGEMLQYVHTGYSTRFEKEIILHVKNRRVVKKKIKRRVIRKLTKWLKIKCVPI